MLQIFASNRLRAFCAGAVASAGLLSGCSVMPPIDKPVPQSVPTSEIAADREAAAARSRSLERTVAGVNAETVRAWVDRYTAPGGVAPAKTGPRAISIDIDALARRHLAWQLADKLQRDSIAPSAARAVPIEVPALGAPATPATSYGRNSLNIPDVAALPVRPARSLGATVSQRPAIVASRATLDDFLTDLRARQNDLEVAESDLARRALEERIRASTRGAVEAISLAPVSPETALELSNLRLKLLAQLRVPAAQKAAAATQIEAIEKRLNEIWEAQTAAQNARLRAAFEELPARLRREGLQALDEAAVKRDSERYYARLELRALIENRLNASLPGTSDTQLLRLLLPPARVATTDLSVGANSSFQTKVRRAASALAKTKDELRPTRDTRALGKSEDFDGQSVAQLRAQAREDARAWADKLALSWNTKLSDEAGVPDRTNLAIKKLFGGRS